MPTQIRLLVVHSSQTDTRFGADEAGVRATLQRSLAYANDIYARSGVDQQIVLADVMMLDMSGDDDLYFAFNIINYPGDFATYGDAWGDNPPGDYTAAKGQRFRDVAARRVSAQADVVAFWGERRQAPGPVARRIAAVPQDAWMNLPDSAMEDGYTVAHELAHLQGLEHEDAQTQALQAAAGTADVMNFSPTIPGLPPGSPAQFSNPRPAANGQPLGRAFVWDAAAKLNAWAPAFADFRNRLTTPPVRAVRPNPADLTGVSLGDRGELWAVDKAGTPWQWAWLAKGFEARPLPNGTPVNQVSAGGPGQVWALGTDGKLWQYLNSQWAIPFSSARGTHLSVGQDGSVWHVGGSNYIYLLSPGGSGWSIINQGSNNVKVAAADMTHAWKLHDDGTVYELQNPYTANNWAYYQNTPLAKDIAVGRDGTLVCIDQNDELQQVATRGASRVALQHVVPYPDPSSTPSPGLKATHVSAIDATLALKRTTDGRLWKKIAQDGQWVQVNWQPVEGQF